MRAGTRRKVTIRIVELRYVKVLRDAAESAPPATTAAVPGSSQTVKNKKFNWEINMLLSKIATKNLEMEKLKAK